MLELITSYYIPALILLFVLVTFRSIYKPKLSGIPGPSIARYTKFWRLFFVWDGKSPEKYYELHKKYGPIVRTGPQSVDISDPAVIPIIYGISSKYLKTQFYPIQSAVYQETVLYNMFSQIDPAIHRPFKQAVANKFSMTSVRSFEPYVDQCTDTFLEKMRERAGEKINLSEWLQYYAFDVVGEITFQYRFGFMEEGKDIDGMMGNIWGLLTYAGIVGQVPGLNPFLLGNLRLVNFMTRMGVPGPLDLITRICEARIAAYDSEPKDEQRGDFLSWLRLEAEKENGKMTQRDLFNHLSNNLLAGSDTTAIALRSAIYYLLKSPHAYTTLVAEIQTADAAGLLSPHITYEQCLKLPYLQAVLKESLRLHPGIGFPLERYVPPEGATLCGVDLPAGTIVGVNAHVVQRDKGIYGEDAEAFRPERWIEVSAEQLRAMDRAFLAFGGGARTCIGKNISLMEMGKFIPSVLRHFDLEWASDKPEWDTRAYWMHKQAGLIAKMKPRKV